VTKHERYVKRFREIARELRELRQAKAHDLGRPSPVDEAEAFLSHPECNTAWMEKEANKLSHEIAVLRQMPDVSTYDGFQAPALDDGDDLPLG
jgi:hypothetical protein